MTIWMFLQLLHKGIPVKREANDVLTSVGDTRIILDQL